MYLTYKIKNSVALHKVRSRAKKIYSSLASLPNMFSGVTSACTLQNTEIAT